MPPARTFYLVSIQHTRSREGTGGTTLLKADNLGLLQCSWGATHEKTGAQTECAGGNSLTQSFSEALFKEKPSRHLKNIVRPQEACWNTKFICRIRQKLHILGTCRYKTEVFYLHSITFVEMGRYQQTQQCLRSRCTNLLSTGRAVAWWGLSAGKWGKSCHASFFHKALYHGGLISKSHVLPVDAKTSEVGSKEGKKWLPRCWGTCK